MAVQLFVVYLVSVVVCFVLRSYVKKKRNWDQYGVYVNIVKHYKEYIVANFFAVYPFLAVVMAVQVENLWTTGWDLGKEESFLNMMITLALGLVLLFFPLITLAIFPPLSQSTKQTYAIVYNKLHPCNIPTIFDYLLRVFRPFIFILIIFLLR